MMNHTMKGKIAITIEPGVLASIEALRRRTHESRSALVTRALRRLLEEEQHHDRVRAYVDAYRRLPESRAEVSAAERVGRATLALVPWDDE
jgi:hypothetical protein